MKISYNWVREYLPEMVLKKGAIDSPEIMASILTSVGLEVETIHKYEEIPNSLDGLLIGEVISCEKHSNADKLKVAQVNIGQDHALQIVCGAPNISTGQKVVVAPVGTTLFPISGESFSIKNSKIRGIESQGMICAEDEIGLGSDHSGIIILPETTVPGEDATSFFKVYKDWIFDIGLTPNRVDAMSHLGVAKDLCAHFSHHNHSKAKVVDRYPAHFSGIDQNEGIKVELVDTDSCRRYSGIVISGIKVLEAPRWMKDKLKSIGIRPINNIVDITNFILHETGQPLHAFDADKIKSGKIVVKCLSSGAKFTTLDNKERTLDKEDLMICDGAQDPMCFGGVFGGAYSGVTENTTNIFLESAWFDPVSVRKTSFRHNLRTEAATHFEKGVDISNTVNVLTRAAMLIKEYAGGEFLSGIVDVYPNPLPKTEVTLKAAYLKKLSGKVYDMGKVKNIFESLNFETIAESSEQVSVKVPFSNPDISLPADLVEEIMRIDGLDNVTISDSVNISPSIEIDIFGPPLKEKMAGWLTGNGFSEIFTNSITNSRYYDGHGGGLEISPVDIINSLSEELDILRPTMMPTGLETIAYNLNRKNTDLLFFEFGKTYAKSAGNHYEETEHLVLYLSGNANGNNWKTSSFPIDFYFAKGICDAIFKIAGFENVNYSIGKNNDFSENFIAKIGNSASASGGKLTATVLEKFSIKQPVYYFTIDWQKLVSAAERKAIVFGEISKFPQVNRDLSVLVDKGSSYGEIEHAIESLKVDRLSGYKLFDVFESEKLGTNKKSMAINFTFTDNAKTLTDAEVDAMMSRVIKALEISTNAEIRKS